MVQLSGTLHRVAAAWLVLATVTHAAPPPKPAPRVSLSATGETLKLIMQSTQLHLQGKYQEAIPLVKRLLEISTTTFGEMGYPNVKFLNNLGTLYRLTGDYESARPYLERALKIEQTHSGEKGLRTAESLDSLGLLFYDTSELEKARDCFERALVIEKSSPLSEKSLRTAGTLNNLASTTQQMGDIAGSRRFREQALAIYRATVGEKDPRTAVLLNNIGDSLRAAGEFAAAKPYFEQAMAIQRKILKENHPDRAVVLHNYATLLTAIGETQQARDQFLQAITINEKALGEDHPRTAAALNGLGLLYFSMRDYAAAQPCFERALAIQKKVLGEKHPDTAVSLVNLGNLLMVAGKYDEARPDLEQGLAIFRDIGGERDLRTARTLTLLATLDAKLGLWDDAAKLADRSRRILRWKTTQVLPALAEREQLAYLAKNDQTDWHASLAIGLERADDQRFAQLSAAWLLNGKGSAEEASVRRVLATRKAADTQTSELLNQLLQVQTQLANLSQRQPTAETLEKLQTQISNLATEEQRLNRRLGEVGVVPDASDPWVSLDTVRASLPDGAVMVNVIRLQAPQLDEAIEDATPRYVAWLIPKAGDVTIVDLGPAEAIEQAVAQVRQDIERGADSKSLEDLSRLVYAPLAQHLESADRWIISPDASLWLVPWQVLLIGNGQYAVERHQVSYVMSGRELAENKARIVSEEPGLAMANPDYATALETPAKPQLQLAGGDSWRTASGNLLPATWKPLPGTAQEIKSTLPQMTTYLGKEPCVYTGSAATEAAFKLTRQPRVAVLSTHGFFVAEPQIGPADVDPNVIGPLPSLLIENPLLRIGLVLAGADRRDKLTSDETTLVDDGILTGLEIVGTDLRGTELVVLSACNTGLGDVHAGEGVAGLRHAFQLAGAGAVVATLWKIPDAETAWLMDRFWQNLAAGDSKADALRNAQLMILYQRDKLKALAAQGKTGLASTVQRGAAEQIPFDATKAKAAVAGPSAPRPGLAPAIYWAAFTLTGQ